MSAAELLQQYYWLIIVAYAAVSVVFIAYFLTRNKGKVLVRIKTPAREYEKWKKPEIDGQTIVMEKGKGKHHGWAFKFTPKSLIRKQGTFNQFYAVEVNYQAKKAFEYDDPSTNPSQPVWDKKYEEELFEASVIKAAGATTQKIQISPIIYILIAANIMVTVFGILVAAGKISI